MNDKRLGRLLIPLGCYGKAGGLAQSADKAAGTDAPHGGARDGRHETAAASVPPLAAIMLLAQSEKCRGFEGQSPQESGKAGPLDAGSAGRTILPAIQSSDGGHSPPYSLIPRSHRLQGLPFSPRRESLV